MMSTKHFKFESTKNLSFDKMISNNCLIKNFDNDQLIYLEGSNNMSNKFMTKA